MDPSPSSSPSFLSTTDPDSDLEGFIKQNIWYKKCKWGTVCSRGPTWFVFFYTNVFYWWFPLELINCHFGPATSWCLSGTFHDDVISWQAVAPALVTYIEPGVGSIFSRALSVVPGGSWGCRLVEVFYQEEFWSNNINTKFPSLVCLYSCLYSTNLNHNIQGGYCQIRYIVLTVWWAAGSGYPIHQWNVRENNMGRSSTYQRIIGLGTHQQKLYREWSRQQIICSKFRTISNDQSK